MEVKATAESTVTGSLQALLTREPLFPGGVLRVPYSTDLIDIRSRVARALRESGVIEEPLPFESFHHRVRQECVLPLQELAGAPRSARGWRRHLKYVSPETPCAWSIGCRTFSQI